MAKCVGEGGRRTGPGATGRPAAERATRTPAGDGPARAAKPARTETDPAKAAESGNQGTGTRKRTTRSETISSVAGMPSAEEARAMAVAEPATATEAPWSSRVRAWVRAATDVGGVSKLALFTLFGLNLADEFDRLAFSTLTPEIRDAFDLSDQQIVAIGSVSGVFVLLAAIPIGYLADRMPRLRMARIAALVWGAMAVVTGLAWTVPVLFAARFFGGVARSSNDIVHLGLLADYYKPAVHPRVIQIHRLANPLSLGASFLAGAIGAALGWRWAFLLLAIPTFALIATLSRLREPHRGESIDAEAARVAEADGARPPSFLQTWRQLFAIRSLRRLSVAFFVLGMGLFTFGQMLSLFFERVYDFGPLPRGLVSFVYGVGSVVGMVVGGHVGSRLSQRGDFAGLPRLIASGLACFSVSIMLLAVAPWAPLSTLFTGAASAGIGVVIPVGLGLLIRILPPNIRAQGQSFATAASAIGGLSAIPLAGLGESLGYRPAFLVLSLIMLISAPIVVTVQRLIPDDVARADDALLAAGRRGR